MIESELSEVYRFELPTAKITIIQLKLQSNNMQKHAMQCGVHLLPIKTKDKYSKRETDKYIKFGEW